MTGRSAGHCTTTDIDGNMYVVGGFKTTSANAQFSGGNTSTAIQPSPLGLASESAGYLVKYDPVTADPLASAVMLPNGACASYGTTGLYADAQKAVVARNGHIYVLGVFYGCGLDLFDSTGVFAFTAFESIVTPSLKQHVFLAHYDNAMTPISCHVFAGADCSDLGLAADLAIGYNDYNSLFFAANFCGDAVWAERFPSGPQPIPPYDQLPINAFSTANPAEYQIYVGQIDMATDQLVYALEIGRTGEDLASELSSGYLGSGSNLYMCGTFTDSIRFGKTGIGSTSYVTNGKWDIFAVRFNGFDLNSQDEAVAGGPAYDQALALSDDGKYVGGFISENANFPGVGVITGIGLGQSIFINSGFKQQGFIAIPDYTSHNWIWQTDVVDNGLPNVLDSQVNDISNGDCDDFYVAWNRGMMSRPLDLPQVLWTHPTLNDMNTTQLHLGTYSRIEKWEDLGASATNIWQHDFNAPPNPTYNLSTGPIGSGVAVKARFISDIQVRSQVSIGAPGDEDVLFTGRFGDDMAVTNSILPGFDFYDANNGSPFLHNEVSMFCGALDEHPNFTEDTIEVCLLNDPFTVPWDFIPGAPFSYPFTVGSEITFSGPGVDPATGVFTPSSAGVGTHTIWLHLDYYGCTSSHPVALIEVIADEIYPKQPLSVGTEWAEGLCAEGLSYEEILELGGLNVPDDLDAYEMYFLGGKYFNHIEFEKYDGSMIELDAQGGGEAGYIVAYGPCGAFWALNVDGSGSGTDYIEALEIRGNDQSGLKLYATGGIEGGGTLALMIDDLTPVTATNTTNGFPINGGATGFVEKGIVMQIEPLTGDVLWVYVGGNGAAEVNRFHDLAVHTDHLGVVGERSTTFNGFGGLNGTKDAFIVVLDMNNGNFIETSLSNGAGTFGTTGDDFGNSIDLLVDGNNLLFYVAGTFEGTSNVAHGFTNSIPFANPLPTPFGQKDIFLSTHSFDLNTYAMTDDLVRVYYSIGDEDVYDIELATDEFGFSLSPADFGSNMVFICGTFSDNLSVNFPPTVTMTTTGASDYDIFIGATDFFFNDQWFTHEGSDQGAIEAARSLDILGTDVFVSGERQRGLFPTITSNRWNSGTPIAGTFSPFPPNPMLALNGTEVFAIQFDPFGGFIDGNFTIPQATGPNHGHDVTVSSNLLVTAGTIGIPFNNTMEFQNSALSTHKSAIQNSNTLSAYLGRLTLSSMGYYKKGEDVFTEDEVINSDCMAFPNPNSGLFSLQFSSEISGIFYLFNSMGGIVFQKSIDRPIKQLDVNLELSNGLYYYEIQGVCAGKMVVQD